MNINDLKRRMMAQHLGVNELAYNINDLELLWLQQMYGAFGSLQDAWQKVFLLYGVPDYRAWLAQLLGTPLASRAVGDLELKFWQSATAAELPVSTLFIAGEQGAWYDPSDLSTLYQDAAGTIPVTANGDPVGLMLDKSGNGNHATQSVAASRPVYRTDGTLHWLAFDGGDDVLSIPTASNLTRQASFVGAYMATTMYTETGERRLLTISTPVATTVRFVLFSSVASDSLLSLGVRRLDGDSFKRVIDGPSSGIKVITAEADWTVNTASISTNGGVAVEDTNIQTPGVIQDTASSVVSIGGFINSVHAKQDFRGLVLTTTPPSPDSKLRIVDYLSLKSGVVL